MIFWDFCGLKPFETSNLQLLQPGCSCCSIPGAWQHWGSAELPSRQPRCDSYVFRCVLGCIAMDIYGYRIYAHVTTCYSMLQHVATCYNMLQPMSSWENKHDWSNAHYSEMIKNWKWRRVHLSEVCGEFSFIALHRRPGVCWCVCLSCTRSSGTVSLPFPILVQPLQHSDPLNGAKNINEAKEGQY